MPFAQTFHINEKTVAVMSVLTNLYWYYLLALFYRGLINLIKFPVDKLIIKTIPAGLNATEENNVLLAYS